MSTRRRSESGSWSIQPRVGHPHCLDRRPIAPFSPPRTWWPAWLYFLTWPEAPLAHPLGCPRFRGDFRSVTELLQKVFYHRHWQLRRSFRMVAPTILKADD